MIFSRIKNIVVCLFVIGLFCLPTLIKADNEIPVQASDISVNTSPENPQPYDDVTITLSSFSTDLTKANIEWKSGSSVLISGYGKTSYSFKAGGPNTKTAFSITMTLDTGDNITKEIIIAPSEVGLLWQAIDSYTPPFYRGKAFVSQEGTIRVVAIPNTNTIKKGAGNVTYSWSSRGDAQQDASGYGKNAYTFQNSNLNSEEKISVTASSVDGQYNATNNITVPIASPKVIFYEKSPTDGIFYNQALGGETSLAGDQMTIAAAPYYLPIKGNEDKFGYHWKINEKDIDTPSRKTELTVHPTSHDGYATINLSFENLASLFQKVAGQLTLNL